MSSNPVSHSRRQSLPPLRSVLGDELALPVAVGHSYPSPSPYDLREIRHALPPRGGAQEYRTPGRAEADTSTPYAPRREHKAHGHASAAAGQGRRPMTSTSTYGHGQAAAAAPADHGPREAGRESVKKYVCTWEGCNRRFERQNALDTHMNIHLDQKPFACPVPSCRKGFNVRSNMRRHLLTHKEFPEDDARSPPEDDPRAHGDPRYPPSPEKKKYAPSSAHYYSSSRRP